MHRQNVGLDGSRALGCGLTSERGQVRWVPCPYPILLLSPTWVGVWWHVVGREERVVQSIGGGVHVFVDPANLHGLRRQLRQQDSMTLFDSNAMSRELVVGREASYGTRQSIP